MKEDLKKAGAFIMRERNDENDRQKSIIFV